MIVATPHNWMRMTFDLTDASGSGAPFGEVAFRLFGGGRLTIGANDYDLTARSTGTRYELTQGGRTIATAVRPSIFRRHYLVEADGVDADLKGQGWFGRRWNLIEHGVLVGEARWSGEIRRRLRASFPDDLPLVVQSFLVAMLVAERRRQGNN